MRFNKRIISFCLVISILLLQVPVNVTFAVKNDTAIKNEIALSLSKEPVLENGVLTVNLSEDEFIKDQIENNNIDVTEISSVVIYGFFNEKNAKYIKETFGYTTSEESNKSDKSVLNEALPVPETKVPRLDLIDLTNTNVDHTVSLNFFDGLKSDTKVIFPDKLTNKHICNGFILDEVFYSIDRGKASLFKHVNSGAKFLLLQHDEDTKEFSLTFKTVPSDDTGINHILEHCLVSSSTKYRSDSVIHAMSTQYLNSMVNAFTADNCTSYVLASESKEELIEMSKTTVDCIFCPSVLNDKRFFDREGIRYQLNDKDGPITVNGIVYHEMERSYNQVWDIIKKQLFANSCFRWCTGGNPIHILDATYENLKSTYNRFYKPSNSLFFLSGNFNDDEVGNFLGWLDCEYLSNCDDVIVSPVAMCSNDEMCPAEKYKEVSFLGSEKKEFLHEIVSVSYVVLDDISFLPICSLLSSELEKMGYTLPDIFCTETGNPVVFVVLVNPKDRENFTIELLKNDIDNAFRNILATEDLEKQFAEYNDGDSANFGSFLNFFNISNDFSNDRIFDCLKSKNKYQKPLSKNDICSFIENNFLNNKKFAITKFLPDSSLISYRHELKNRLEEYKQGLSENETNMLVKNTKDFDNWVKSSNFLSLRDLRKSDVLSSIKLDVKRNKVTKKTEVAGKKAEWKKDDTYKDASFWFSALRVPENKVMFLTLLAQLAQLTPDFIEDDSGKFIPLWNLSSSDLEYTDNPLKCVNEIFAENYDYKKEIKKVALSEASYDTLSDLYETYKPFSKFFVYKDFLHSKDYFKFIKFILDNIDNESFLQFLKEQLINVSNLTFCNNNIKKIAFSSSSEEKLAMEDWLSKFINNLPNSTASEGYIEITMPNIKTLAIDKGETISENSAIACAKLSENCDISNEELHVLAALIKNNYLIPEIRLKGGTYDVQFFFTKEMSTFTMMTSQDANVMDSVKVFGNIPNFLKDATFTQNDIDTAIFSVLNYSSKHPSNVFGDCAQEELDKKVDKIKSLSADKLMGYVPMLEKIFKNCNIVVTADSETITQNADMFDVIKSSNIENSCSFRSAA